MVNAYKSAYYRSPFFYSKLPLLGQTAQKELGQLACAYIRQRKQYCNKRHIYKQCASVKNSGVILKKLVQM